MVATSQPTQTAEAAPLVERCQEGDPEAFAELFTRYWPDAVAIARHVVRDPLLAEDVAQEAFIKVYRRIDGFAFRAQFRSWLYRVVVNQAISTLRQRSHRERPEENPNLTASLHGRPPSPLEDQVAEDDERRRIREVVASLGKRHRQLVVWKYFQGLTDEQIAHQLGCPVGTVKSRLHRARRQLEQNLAHVVEGL